jgi:hypothetical protein
VTRIWHDVDVIALGSRTDLATAGDVLNLSRSHAYELHARGEFPVPVLTIGKRYVVPTRALRDLLGITSDSSEAAAPTAAIAHPPTALEAARVIVRGTLRSAPQGLGFPA